jgi:hypothetical protein
MRLSRTTMLAAVASLALTGAAVTATELICLPACPSRQGAGLLISDADGQRATNIYQTLALLLRQMAMMPMPTQWGQLAAISAG